MLLITGLAFAVAGQYYFAHRREYVWDGVLLYGIGAALLLALMRQAGRPRWWVGVQRAWRWVRAHPGRTTAAVGGATACFLAGWAARVRDPSGNFAGLFWLWLGSGVWYLLAFLPAPDARERFDYAHRRWWRRAVAWLRERGSTTLTARRWELLALGGLLLVALAVRAVNLEHIPANLGGDEGTQGVVALRLVEPPVGNPFSTGWFSVPTMSFLAYGFAMKVFGASVGGLRALSALTGTATVLTTFLLARELWGRRVGWLAAVALTFSHYHLHFSRLGSNQIADGLFVTLGLYLLVRALRAGGAFRFALAGTVLGAAWYGYFGARLTGLIVVLYLAWRTVVEYRFLERHRSGLLLLGLSAAIVLSPLLLHYAVYPGDLTARYNQVSTFASGWLANERMITGRSAASLLLEQFWKSISAFHYTLDPTFWYLASIPLLDVVSGVLMIVGLVWASYRWRRPSNGLLLTWFWSLVILGWTLTENPPSSMRGLIIAPALAILVGLGLNWLMRVTQRVLRLTFYVSRFTFHVSRLTCCILLVAVALLNLHYYFVTYTPTRVYGNPTAEIATVLSRYLDEQDDSYVVYLHGPPWMYWDFGTIAFMARGVEGVSVPPRGEGEPVVVDQSRGARFVFLPERLEELEEVQTTYPGGTRQDFYHVADDGLMFVLYEVPPP